jgi:hypothetical protein
MSMSSFSSVRRSISSWPFVDRSPHAVEHILLVQSVQECVFYSRIDQQVLKQRHTLAMVGTWSLGIA